MPTYTGDVRRSKPRVNVLRGFAGNEPQSITRSAPVADGQTIASGQAISLDANGKWVLGVASGDTGYIAYHDSSDPDVAASGKLMGLSSLGSFEIESAHLSGTADFAIDAEVHALSDGTLSHTGGVKIGICTGTVNLGPAGHTTSNPRGGNPGTIAEDSTGTFSTADPEATPPVTGGNLNAITFVTSA